MQEVDGSSPFVPTIIKTVRKLRTIRGYSTVGSAIRSQRIGLGFESPYLHHEFSTLSGAFFVAGGGCSKRSKTVRLSEAKVCRGAPACGKRQYIPPPTNKRNKLLLVPFVVFEFGVEPQFVGVAARLSRQAHAYLPFTEKLAFISIILFTFFE